MEPCGAAGLSIVVSLEWIQFQPDPHDFVDLRIFGTEFPDPLYLINQIREIINQISITEFSVQYCKNCCGMGRGEYVDLNYTLKRGLEYLYGEMMVFCQWKIAPRQWGKELAVLRVWSPLLLPVISHRSQEEKTPRHAASQI